MQRIFVTGATGFVGRHVVPRLMESGHAVRILARGPVRQNLLPEGVEVSRTSLTDQEGLEAALSGMDAVVHLVAIIRERGEATFDRVNHLGTASLAKAALNAGVSRFVLMGAIGAVDDPRFPYLQSKWRGEQALIQSGVPYTILRGSIIFGEGDEFINALAGLVRVFPLVPVIGEGKVRFQAVHVEDVAHSIARTLELDDTKDRIIEIGGPEHITYDGILDTIAETYGSKRWKLHLPIGLMRPVVKLMEKLLPHPPATSQQLSMLEFDNIADTGAVSKEFGFSPRPLAGNIDYIRKVSFLDGVKMVLGRMPDHIRDH